MLTSSNFPHLLRMKLWLRVQELHQVVKKQMDAEISMELLKVKGSELDSHLLRMKAKERRVLGDSRIRLEMMYWVKVLHLCSKPP